MLDKVVHTGWASIVPPVFPFGRDDEARIALLPAYYGALEQYYAVVRKSIETYGVSRDVAGETVGGDGGTCVVVRGDECSVLGCCSHCGGDRRQATGSVDGTVIGRVDAGGGGYESNRCGDGADCGGGDAGSHGGLSDAVRGLELCEETCGDIRVVRNGGHIGFDASQAAASSRDGFFGGTRESLAVNAVEEVPVPVGGVNTLGYKGPNWHRNQIWKDEKRKKKQRRRNVESRSGFFSGCDDNSQRELADSRLQRYIAENRCAAERAIRDLAVLSAGDVESEVKFRRSKLAAATERNYVSIEKTHATLVATGNVPGEMAGFAATIVGSGSISPNSSVSEAEFRACQKKLVDLEAKYELSLDLNDKLSAEKGIDSIRQIRQSCADNDLYSDNTENRNMFDEQEIDYMQSQFFDGKIQPLFHN